MSQTPPDPACPLRILARNDLHLLYQTPEGVFVVKDPVTSRFFHLLTEHRTVMQLLDGTRSLATLVDEMKQRCAQHAWTSLRVLALINDLLHKNLVYVVGADESLIETKGVWWKRQLHKLAQFNPIFIQFPGLSPGWAFDAVVPFVRWLFRPTIQILLSLICLSGFLLLCWNMRTFSSEAFIRISYIDLNEMIMLGVAVGFCKVVHELSHAVCARRLGVEVRQIGFALMLMTPCLYCDIQDAWKLKSKWGRIQISLAGIYAESILGFIAVLVWLSTDIGPAHQFALHVMSTTLFGTFLINLNPLIRSDGYHVLQDFLGTSNLKERSQKETSRQIISWTTGRESSQRARKTLLTKAGYLIYATCSELYSVILLWSISAFLVLLLAPWGLMFIPRLVLFQSLTMIVWRWGLYLSKEYRQSRVARFSPFRFLLAWSLIGLGVWTVLFVPIPEPTFAHCLASPAIEQEVTVRESGVIAASMVQSGSQAELGQPLVVLGNSELTRDLLHAQTKLHQQKIQTLAYEQNLRPELQRLSRETEKQLQGEVEHLYSQATELTLVAKREGVVLEEESSIASNKVGKHLPAFAEEPRVLSEVGAFLPTRAKLLTLVDPTRWQATILTTLEQRKRLDVGQEMILQLDAISGVEIRARVDHIQLTPVSVDDELTPGWQEILRKEQLLRLNQQQPASYYPVTVSWTGEPRCIVRELHGWALVSLPSKTLAERTWEFFSTNPFEAYLDPTISESADRDLRLPEIRQILSKASQP